MSQKSNQTGIYEAPASRTQASESGGTKLTSTLRETLRAGACRYTGKTGGGALLSAYLEPGFRFTYYLRKVAYYSTKKKSLGIFGYIYNRILYHHYAFKYGFDISPATSIVPGLFICHFGGVVISPYAVLGANINIAQGVTIGA